MERKHARSASLATDLIDTRTAVKFERFMTTPVSCNACNGALITRFGAVLDPQTRETFSIASCEVCGLGHTTPQPDDLSRYYGATYHGGRHGLTANYCAKRRVRIITSVVGSGQDRRLLDVGCGDGTFLLAARAHGWNVTGTEVNPDIARAAGLDVRSSLDQVQNDGQFDCITLWHSLEHLRDPLATLTQLAGILKPQGSLVVAVPNAQGLQAKVFGSGWFHLDVPRHLYHFGDRSLTHALSEAGLTVLRRWHQEFEYDVFGWAQSALNKVLPEPNQFFNRLTGRETDSQKSPAISVLLGLGATALALPATVFGTLLGQGGTLIVVARR